MKLNKIYVAVVALLLGTACTDLDENVYSEVSKKDFYQNSLEIKQAAFRPFTHMQAWLAIGGERGYYYHNELSADQLAWPQKGRHGYDNGDHIRLHYHTWTSQENRITECWNLMWTGIGYINSAIQDIEGLKREDYDLSETEWNNILNELKVLRAYHYLKVMDLFGNVPIVTEVPKDPYPTSPETKSRKEVFDFVRTELETYVPKLAKYDESMIGRVSQTAGYAMLSELYLNAEVWAGEKMYDKCIEVSNKIINGDAGGLGGAPVLADSLLETFSNTNHYASENLFQFAYSKSAGFTFNWASLLAGFSYYSEILDVDYTGNNAVVVIPSAFDAFEDNDARKEAWFLFGPQYYYGADSLVKGTEEYKGEPIIFVNTIRRESEGDLTSAGGMTQGEENSGARFNKYRSGRQSDANYWENHYIIYRLTEIYFNKAEAIMRQNNGVATQEAVDLINASRQRAFTKDDWVDEQYTTAELTMDELLAERGREFIFEGKRRTDLIRFGKFVTTSWWDHQPSNDPNKRLFPIPYSAKANNDNLEQNDGY